MTDPHPASPAPLDPTTTPAANATPIESPAPAPEAATTAVAQQSPSEDLPEWEPLSPEIVEDEAIRGDFMLRWAVILLGLLLGCRQIAETQTLVRIRTGEYLTSHGILPPRTDIFSYTAGDRTWVNLSWLFDLSVGLLHRLGGPLALSVGVGLAGAALIYGLVNLNRSKLPTWWHAVCAGVLLLALFPQFVPLPKLVTLLGVAWCLRELIQWTTTKQPRSLWCVVVTLAVWSNLDARAYFGWLLLAGFGVGQFVSAQMQRTPALSAEERQSWLKIMGAGLGALVLNPFGWNAWFSPWVRVATELPWLRANGPRITDLGTGGGWQSLFDRVAWTAPSPVMIATAVLVLMGLVTTYLNRRRVDLGLLFAVALVCLFGAMSWEDFAPALVALCVLSSLNGQDWYRDHCRQEYSIATSEVLFSRAGRAVTVIAFGALAYFAISGRLMGRDGPRVGFGWTPQLAATIAGAVDELQDFENARLFQFRLDQGDVVIWAGRKVFFDSRVALYARGGENVLNLQDEARNSLRPVGRRAPAGAGMAAPTNALNALEDDSKQSAGREVLKRFEVTHLTPRLWGQTPGYGALVDVIQSPDWRLERLGATCAIFGRKPVVVEKSRASGIDFAKLAFRDCKPSVVNPARITWPQPQTGYQRFLSLKGTPVSNFGQRARHYIELLQTDQNGHMQLSALQALGMCFLAIRDAQAAVFEDNSNVSAYITLADAYNVLELLESRIYAAGGRPPAAPQRLYQSTAALQQALVLEPNNLGLRGVLVEKYRAMNRVDAMYGEVQKLMALYKDKPTLTKDDIAVLARLREYNTQLGPAMERMEKAVSEAQDKNTDPLALSTFAVQQGFVVKALEILEADKLKLAGNMQVHLQMAMLMSEVGRLDESNTLFESFDEMGGGEEPVFGAWQVQAAFVAMARGDYDRAVAWGQKHRKSLTRTSFEALLGTAPFKSFDSPLIGTKTVWPTAHLAASDQVLFNISDQSAMLTWMMANAHMEIGRCADATREIKTLLTNHPHSNYSTLASVYLQMLTDEPLSISIPGERVPILFEDGTGDSEKDAK